MSIGRNNAKIKQNTFKFSYTKLIISYLIICLLCIGVTMPIFNRVIKNHDKEMANDISSLIAEKTNSLFYVMTEASENIARLISAQKTEDGDALYESLRNTIDDAGYISIGIINMDGSIYGTEPEKTELKKWGLVDQAIEATGTFASEPYRSEENGKMVITLFTPIYGNGTKIGSLFITYALDYIQEMTSSEVIGDDTEIYLMNAYSGNYISCKSKDASEIGSWRNVKLIRDLIQTDNDENYAAWEQKMRDGEKTGIIHFTMNGVEYTQVFEKLETMYNWDVVVRIPSSTFTNPIHILQKGTIILFIVLVTATIIIYLISQKYEMAEKKMLEKLSVYDGLTQLFNRRSFEGFVNEYIEKHSKKEKSSLIFVDVDHFKDVNDTYGHEAGDNILKEFANSMRKSFASNCMLGRFGGDEFVVFIPGNTDKKVIEGYLEKFKTELSKITLEGAKEDFAVRYSAGIALLEQSTEDVDSLENKADAALYEAKNAGRNMFKWYNASMKGKTKN